MKIPFELKMLLVIYKINKKYLNHKLFVFKTLSDNGVKNDFKKC